MRLHTCAVSPEPSLFIFEIILKYHGQAQLLFYSMKYLNEMFLMSITTTHVFVKIRKDNSGYPTSTAMYT